MQWGQEAAFGELVLRHRRTTGLTQEELADAAGMSVRAIGDIERGRARGPQRRSVDALADALRLAERAREEFLAAARRGRRRTPAGPSKPDPSGGLIGRDTELAELRAFAEQVARGAVETPVAVISGLPGVGKTSLLTAAAHTLADLFPDGRFLLDLRGMDEPLTPARALDRLLRLLGVPETEIRGSLAERTRRYRSLLAGKRALITLDDVPAAAAVLALLPGTARCLVLVAGRRALTELPGGHRRVLDVLRPGDAVALLARIAGARRVRAEPGSAAEVARLCGNLPLALRLAGHRLAMSPQWMVKDLVAMLAEERRLSLLSAGHLQLRTAFAVSYRQLGERARLVFRHLSVLPGADFTPALAAVAAGIAPDDAARVLTALAEASLVRRDGNRYQLHGLLRTFAVERFREEEPPSARRAATDRANAWLVHTATRAGLLFDVWQRAEPGGEAATIPLRTCAEAEAWLDAEAGNWIPAIRYAAHARWHHDVIAVTRALHWFSYVRLRPHPWPELFGLGLSAARAADSPAEEVALRDLLRWALAHRAGHGRGALPVREPAFELTGAIGDRPEETWAKGHRVAVPLRLGEPEAAFPQHEPAVAVSAR
ncbi:helix-turn-helix domain-containing protein [Amycolatopsis samaneae]|uniref:Helix-turn-helix domain-containing protein n=1 Tax=Amycolatopsis samaneae TaxID=664691 RepID=A0ABW5GRJ0_9PSEU